MSRYNPGRNIEALLAAAHRWIEHCLVRQGSLFSGKNLWTTEVIDQVRAAFTDNPDESDAGFFEKLEGQMRLSSGEATQLMAEFLWVLMLFQTNIRPVKKRESIARVWDWSGDALDMAHPLLSDAVLAGVGSPGTAYNTQRWRELNYIIGLARDIAARPMAEREAVLEDRDRFEQWIAQAPQEGYRQFRHLFRYLAFPDRNERITVNRDRREILEAFTDLDGKAIKRMSDAQQDDALAALREKLKAEHGLAELDFYEPAFAERWRGSVGEDAARMRSTFDEETGMDREPNEPGTSRPPLNQVLFGPPGTGKTFHSVNKALEILDPHFLAQHSRPEQRRALKDRFDELVEARRIRFVTFHQSFSYEDFVEGLRAESDEEGRLRYRVEPGVFKSICEDARGAAQVASEVGIREGARIWKLSIDGTVPSATRDYCFAHGEARIGWGEVGDLRREDLAGSVEYRRLGSNDRNTLEAFSGGIEPGDVVLCIGSATHVQAIGVVQGEYRFQDAVPREVRQDYANVLPVRWLATGLSLDLRALNGGLRFTLKTVYEITRFDWPELAEVVEAASIRLNGSAPAARRQPLDHVLIIDEINRGNVSRIFGELITLIEPSKRSGADEQLEVVLPYSKKPFTVPGNVHLVGTMNTSDRSLAGIDIALRRRFQFVEMPPRPDFLKGVRVAGVSLQELLEVMNQRIEALLDKDHCLGHAYFMPLVDGDDLAPLATIFRNQVLPLLQEYFFEDWERIGWVLNDHRKSAGARFIVPAGYDADSLFGREAEAPGGGRLWRLDERAFGNPESYRGIIRASQG